MLRHTLLLFFLLILTGPSQGQPGQINIQRVESMPNMPTPYVMRNWKDVAVKYDELVYSTTVSGQYLPLVHFQLGGYNYPPIDPILLSCLR